MAITSNLSKQTISEDESKVVVTDEYLVLATSGEDITDVNDAFSDIWTNKYTSLYLKSKRAETVEPYTGGIKYRVTLTYDSSINPPSGGGGGGSSSPLDQPPIYSYETEDVEEIVDFDVDGKPVLNSVAAPFDPPLTRTVTYPVLVAEVNQSFVNFTYIYQLNNGVNDAMYKGAAKGTLRCKATAREVTDSSIGKYNKVTYRFIYRASGWQAKIPNLSYVGKDATRWEGISHILDATNNPISQPVPIELDGTPMTTPIVVENIPILEFKKYNEVDFTQTGV